MIHVKDWWSHLTKALMIMAYSLLIPLFFTDESIILKFELLRQGAELKFNGWNMDSICSLQKELFQDSGFYFLKNHRKNGTGKMGKKRVMWF